MGLLIGTATPLQAQDVVRSSAMATAYDSWHFADSIVLRIPGSSRFAGIVRGAEGVRGQLAALRQVGTQDRATMALYTTVEGRPLVLTRTTIRVRDSRHAVVRVVQLITIPTFDERGDVHALDVFIDDLPAFDRHAPREDGVRIVSLAMQRNLEQVRALYGRGGAAQFLAANAHQVVVLLDDTVNASGARAAVMRYQFDAAGRVKQLEQFAPSCLVAMVRRNTGR